MKKTCLALFFFFSTTTTMAITNIIAAENNDAIIAQMIGGPYVHVTSIMNNPNQDPHLFSIDPSTIKKLHDLTKQDIFIVNGADYDAWATNLSQHTAAFVINVATINHIAPNANPHLWYDLNNVQQTAETLTQQLSLEQPEHQQYFKAQLTIFLKRLFALNQEIAGLRARHHGAAVTATEPVADYLLRALNLKILNESFQLKIMNDTEPSPQERANFLHSLHTHAVCVFIYNKQVNDPTTETMRIAATKAGIPVVGLQELLPTQTTDFLTWYNETLNAIAQALKSCHPAVSATG